MIKPVFIGGTGRSGTNVLRDVLSNSSKVASPQFETRYTVEPDGVLPFLRRFSSPVSPFEADALIERHFTFLKRVAHRSPLACRINHLLKHLPGNAEETRLSGIPYAEWDLETHAPGYSQRLSCYMTWFERQAYRAVRPGMRAFTKRPRMFFASSVDRPALVEQAARFVEGNIRAVCEKEAADIYVDDNTFNLVYAVVMREILPTAKFIHVRRNPLDVVASYCKQRWCPGDPILAATIVARLLETMDGEINAVPKDTVLDVTLEDLLENPSKEVSKICEFIGLEDKFDTSSLQRDRANIGRATRELSPSTLKAVEEKLGDAVKKFTQIRKNAV